MATADNKVCKHFHNSFLRLLQRFNQMVILETNSHFSLRNNGIKTVTVNEIILHASFR